MIKAGAFLEEYTRDLDYVVFKCTMSYFGNKGGVMLLQYDKNASTETGISIQVYESYILSDNKVLEGDERTLRINQFQLTESDGDGNVVPWVRQLLVSNQCNFPVPFSHCKIIVYVKVSYIGDISNVTSNLTIHLINNDY